MKRDGRSNEQHASFQSMPHLRPHHRRLRGHPRPPAGVCLLCVDRAARRATRSIDKWLDESLATYLSPPIYLGVPLLVRLDRVPATKRQRGVPTERSAWVLLLTGRAKSEPSD